MTAYCSTHRAWLPLHDFYPASLRAKETRCKACNRRHRSQRRRQTLLHHLHWNMYHSEHRRRDAQGAAPTLDVATAAWTRFQGCSAIDGATQDLCIVRFYPHLPLGRFPWNAALVTVPQARRLPRRTHQRAAAFPLPLQQAMAAQALEEINKVRIQKQDAIESEMKTPPS